MWPSNGPRLRRTPSRSNQAGVSHSGRASLARAYCSDLLAPRDANRSTLLPDAMKPVYVQVATPRRIIVEVGPDFSIYSFDRDGTFMSVTIGNILNRAVRN